MAKKVLVEQIDDISGESGATTTRFGLDGVDYEIDLLDDQELRDHLAPWIAKSRRISGNGQAKAGSALSNGYHRHDMHRIRAWARTNGLKTPARGRMPAAIIEAYDNQKHP
jgi:hypothetical protein